MPSHFSLCQETVDPFAAQEHAKSRRRQKEGEDGNGRQARDGAEQGRHQCAARVSESHLNPHELLGVGAPKTDGGFVEHGGINGGIAQANQQQGGAAQDLRQGKQEQKRAESSQNLSAAESGASNSGRITGQAEPRMESGKPRLIKAR